MRVERPRQAPVPELPEASTACWHVGPVLVPAPAAYTAVGPIERTGPHRQTGIYL